ncbi:3-phosphoshikimate 1-carboxyvinyltransferase [Emcibacter nanhaiensis]|uniref:3-phosphoshikimate 1-carboxyvinyltransferase n=1 Tax=Emcibacter nanhaiensis TaxID=1505037 RepID=A0A501PPE6_9PROT|nr:3-phosphoshikimate 1-carboxyvinyltransferase [Emcibacter nanhaiensis]TPD61854.1 3-phosphoshikimate 1-carboxyvinyltransferase [Emcibacter nanhaiensis]
MNQLLSSATDNLKGTVNVPGDKSISHRALIMGSLAIGETLVAGLLEGEDVLNTAAAMRALGADIRKDEDGTWHIHGVGVGALHEPEGALDMGNSGTGARLLMGLISTYPFSTTFIGDASLSSRPMKRVTDPLESFGAEFHGSENGTLPLTVRGTGMPVPISYDVPVASAQVKSAIMLAALNTPGTTTIFEKKPTRDHTERMFSFFGVDTTTTPKDSGRVITVTGQPELTARNLTVPGDPSSAAFPVVAALITPGSDITIRNVGLNPDRTGLFITLKEMGADIEFVNEREDCGEPVADLRVRHSRLKAITVPQDRAPSMIDEYPILCIAAAFADGTTMMRGAEELRVKESDRIAIMVKGLRACGIDVEEFDDGMAITGSREKPAGGAVIETHLDHRIAMSFLTLGLQSEQPVTVDDGSVIETSFPIFRELMNGLGANIHPAGENK